MFCQWFLQQCGTNPNFPAFVIFTDEAQFTRDEIQNFRNQHMWANENPREILPSHQQRFSFNMWSGICGDNLFGSHVLPQAYRAELQSFFWETTSLISWPTCH
jgi:hypothetical protein